MNWIKEEGKERYDREHIILNVSFLCCFLSMLYARMRVLMKSRIHYLNTQTEQYYYFTIAISSQEKLLLRLHI